LSFFGAILHLPMRTQSNIAFPLRCLTPQIALSLYTVAKCFGQ